MDELKDHIFNLAAAGIWPPYTLIVTDGQGNEVHFNVTMTFEPCKTESPST